MVQNFPGGPVAIDSTLPLQGVWVRSLVGKVKIPQATQQDQKKKKTNKPEMWLIYMLSTRDLLDPKTHIRLKQRMEREIGTESCDVSTINQTK